MACRPASLKLAFVHRVWCASAVVPTHPAELKMSAALVDCAVFVVESNGLVTP